MTLERETERMLLREDPALADDLSPEDLVDASQCLRVGCLEIDRGPWFSPPHPEVRIQRNWGAELLLAGDDRSRPTPLQTGSSRGL